MASGDVSQALATWVSTSELRCTFPTAVAGDARLFIGYQGVRPASFNEVALFVHQSCPAGTYLPSLYSTACQLCPPGVLRLSLLSRRVLWAARC